MSEPHRSAGDFLVLHTLACIGVASMARVAVASVLSPAETTDHLNDLSARGLIELDPGLFGGWSLTATGRTMRQRMLTEELDLTGTREHVDRCYREILPLNPMLLQVCSDWQIRSVGSRQVVNDHADPDYDAKVMTRLMRLDDEAQEICADVASRLERFGVYGRRLSNAIDRVMAGSPGHVADKFDSYHTVWAQLHEDLLSTLGISRDEERRDLPGE